MQMHYLDWAATSIPDKTILRETEEIALHYYGNPSSFHKPGTAAGKKLGEARETCASLLNVKPEQLIFTSGGTEANNLVFGAFLRKKAGFSVVVSGIEHPSGYEPAFLLQEGNGKVITVNPGNDGILDPDAVSEVVDKNTALVSVMLVNNETGAIQPVGEIAERLRRKEKEYGTKIHLHSDMVQAIGKIPVDIRSLDVDSASFSAHKIRGPRGVGILFLKRTQNLLVAGGEQERGYRPGTENLPGIWGMTKALERYVPDVPDHLDRASKLKEKLNRELKRIELCHLIEERVEQRPGSLYSPFITTFFVPPVPGEVLVRVLSDKGFAVSTGSACSRSPKKRTRPLENMGISNETASSAVRVSFGYTTTEDIITQFCSVLAQEVPRLLSVVT